MQKQLLKQMLPKIEAALQNIAKGITHLANMRLKVCIGNESYTDHKMIQVAVTDEEAAKLSLEDVKNVLRFKTLHEVFHILFTTSKVFSEATTEIYQMWKIRAGELGVNPDKQILFDFARLLTNGLEDGRIENLGCYRFQGFKPIRDWYRVMEWSDETLAENTPEWMVLYNQILRTATMGIKVKGFDKFFKGTEVDDLHNQCISHISKGVLSKTTGECMEESKKIAEIIADFVVTKTPSASYMKTIPEELKQLLRKLIEQINDGNITNRSQSNQEDGKREVPEDVPLIAIITDDNNSDEEGEEPDRRPDMVIDLRKNPQNEESQESEEDNNGETSGEASNSDSEDQNSDSSTGSSGNSQENADESNNNSESGDSQDDLSSEELNSETAATQSEESDDSDNNSSSSSEKNSDIQNNLSDDDNSNPLDKEGTLGESKESISDEEMQDILNKRMEKALEEADTDSKAFNREIKQIEIAQQKKESQAQELSKEKITEISQRHGDYGFNETKISKSSHFRKTPTPPELKACTNTLKYQVENLILTKHENDRSEVFEGDFDENELGRFVLGEFNVFKQEGTPFELSMACSILKDNSGSMSGEKDFQCCKAGSMIEEVMKPLMPLRISDFNTYSSVSHTVIKDWDDNDNNINYFWSYYQTNNPSGSNHDGFSIDIAANELLLRPEENKLLVILSDGSPCCMAEEVLQAVKTARKNGIFVISFFFGDQNFLERSKDIYADMYEKYYIGVTPENIGKEFIKFLKIFVEGI